MLEAKALLDKGFPKGAANRAYYAMFYAVQAALGLVNVKKPKSHTGAITLFVSTT
ncbi:MAG: HEPN domain-containing protein [Dehalococcoidia bacterium]|nr:HEPN domain-containing protein [Dehalococcoidia bacterium]